MPLKFCDDMVPDESSCSRYRDLHGVTSSCGTAVTNFPSHFLI